MGALICGDTFFLDSFALRQWEDPEFAGTRLAHDRADFVRRVHAAHAAGTPLVDGYAPFCKHLFVPNFCAGLPVGDLPITDANRHLLRSGYTRRRPEELPVLNRWFPAEAVEPTEAKYLDIILYSREQLEKEREALPSADKQQQLPDVPWGIISIKAQDEDFELTMTPITMMRNALGREEGGSGVPVDRQKYEDSAAYWDSHAAIQ